jgi:hypothetical protein
MTRMIKTDKNNSSKLVDKINSKISTNDNTLIKKKRTKIAKRKIKITNLIQSTKQ